jgi:hypothetical protein
MYFECAAKASNHLLLIASSSALRTVRDPIAWQALVGLRIVPESREQLCARTKALSFSHINYVLMCGRRAIIYYS